MQRMTPFQFLAEIYNKTSDNEINYYLMKYQKLYQMALVFELERPNGKITIDEKSINKPSKYLQALFIKSDLERLQFLFNKDRNRSLTKVYPEIPTRQKNYKIDIEKMMNPMTVGSMIKILADIDTLFSIIYSQLVFYYGVYVDTDLEDKSFNIKDLGDITEFI